MDGTTLAEELAFKDDLIVIADSYVIYRPVLAGREIRPDISTREKLFEMPAPQRFPNESLEIIAVITPRRRAIIESSHGEP